MCLLAANPLVHEIGVEAVAQGHAGNLGTRLGALIDDLGLAGFGIGAALAWHRRSSTRGLKWCPPKTGGHHAASWKNRGGVLGRRLLPSYLRAMPAARAAWPIGSAPSACDNLYYLKTRSIFGFCPICDILYFVEAC
ncbi:Hypothetical protein (plasmid) [Pseudomonas putida]|nr:Hypothetical protein [Pseudomonas putida]